LAGFAQHEEAGVVFGSRTLNKGISISALAATVGLSAFLASESAWACEGIGCVGDAIGQGVQTTGQAVGKGVEVTGHAVGAGVHATGHVVKRGAEATGHVVRRGAQATGHVANKGVHAIGNAAVGTEKAVTGQQ
jgi:hypothetical protein